MATNQHSGFTEALITETENRYPCPTLRLTSAISEARNRLFELECEASKQKIVNDIKEALDDDVEKTRMLLKAMKPSKEGKTEAEYALAVEQFKKSLQIIRGIIEEQTKFNSFIIVKVGNYLVDAWKMIQSGRSNHDCKQFRKDTKYKITQEYQETCGDIQKRIEKEMNLAKGTPEKYKTGNNLFATESPHKLNTGSSNKMRQGGHGQGDHSQGGRGQGAHDLDRNLQGGYGQGAFDQGRQMQGGYGQGAYDQGRQIQGGYGQAAYGQDGHMQGGQGQGYMGNADWDKAAGGQGGYQRQ